MPEISNCKSVSGCVESRERQRNAARYQHSEYCCRDQGKQSCQDVHGEDPPLKMSDALLCLRPFFINLKINLFHELRSQRAKWGDLILNAKPDCGPISCGREISDCIDLDRQGALNSLDRAQQSPISRHATQPSNCETRLLSTFEEMLSH